jgi:hypothetical protein
MVAFEQHEIMAATKARPVLTGAIHRVLCFFRAGNLKARGRVIVRIIDEEQEAAIRAAILIILRCPCRIGVSTKRVSCSRAHKDQRGTLPTALSQAEQKNESPFTSQISEYLIITDLMERRVGLTVSAPRVQQAEALACKPGAHETGEPLHFVGILHALQQSAA